MKVVGTGTNVKELEESDESPGEEGGELRRDEDAEGEREVRPAVPTSSALRERGDRVPKCCKLPFKEARGDLAFVAVATPERGE